MFTVHTRFWKDGNVLAFYAVLLSYLATSTSTDDTQRTLTILDIRRLLSATGAVSVHRCLRTLSVNASRHIDPQVRCLQRDFVSLLNSSLFTLRDIESALCSTPRLPEDNVTSLAPEMDSDVNGSQWQLPVCSTKQNTSDGDGCKYLGASLMTLETKTRACAFNANQQSRSWMRDCRVLSWAEQMQVVSVLISTSATLLEKIKAECDANIQVISGLPGVSNASISGEEANRSISQVVNAKQKLQALLQLLLKVVSCDVTSTLLRASLFTQTVLGFFRPTLHLRESVDIGLLKVLCYTIVEANKSMSSPLCCSECKEVVEALKLLSSFTDLQRNSLSLVHQAVETHCLQNGSLVGKSCVRFSSLNISESRKGSATVDTVPISPKDTCTRPQFCADFTRCRHLFKMTSDKSHWFPKSQEALSFIYSASVQYFPNSSSPRNTTIFPCGLNCNANTPLVTRAVLLVLFAVSIIFTLQVLAVSVSHHSSLHLGRRLSALYVLSTCFMWLRSLLGFLNSNCHSDGTTRLAEPVDFNLCAVSTMLELFSLVAKGPIVAAIGYSFYRMIKLSTSGRKVKRELVDNAYKVELIVVASVLILTIPFWVVVADKRLIFGNIVDGQCLMDNRILLGLILGLMGVASLISIAVVLNGLPEFLRLVGHSKSIAIRRRSKGGTIHGKNRRLTKQAANFLIEVAVFLVMSVNILTIILIFYLILLIKEKAELRAWRSTMLCSMASCNPSEDCGNPTRSLQALIIGARITIHLSPVLLSWWAFKKQYLPNWILQLCVSSQANNVIPGPETVPAKDLTLVQQHIAIASVETNALPATDLSAKYCLSQGAQGPEKDDNIVIQESSLS